MMKRKQKKMLIPYKGENKTAYEWGKITGLSPVTIRARYKKLRDGELASMEDVMKSVKQAKKDAWIKRKDNVGAKVKAYIKSIKPGETFTYRDIMDDLGASRDSISTQIANMIESGDIRNISEGYQKVYLKVDTASKEKLIECWHKFTSMRLVQPF